MSFPRDSIDFKRVIKTWRDLYTSAPDTAQHKDWRDFPPFSGASITDQDSLRSSIPELKILATDEDEPMKLRSRSVRSYRRSIITSLALAAHNLRCGRIFSLDRSQSTLEGDIEYFVDPLDWSDLQ